MYIQCVCINTGMCTYSVCVCDSSPLLPAQVYKEKLRELRRASRSLVKRVEEAAKRPTLISRLTESINISYGFVFRLRNVSAEFQIFTEVEIETLEKLANESVVGGAGG